MFNLDKHPYFKEYTDPKSGVKSYFLKEKAASLQQQFYFCNTSLTADGKYIISTVTLLDGSADVAITPVEPLVKLCREKGKQLN